MNKEGVNIHLESAIRIFHGDAPIALRRKSVSDRGFVSIASHFIRVKIASMHRCGAAVEKVVRNCADPKIS